VRLSEGESVPADLLLLYASNANGYCFVETSNLDGETSLKMKSVPSHLQRYLEQVTAASLQLPPTTAPVSSSSATASTSASFMFPTPAQQHACMPCDDIRSIASTLNALAGVVSCEDPNPRFDQFKGNLVVPALASYMPSSSRMTSPKASSSSTFTASLSSSASTTSAASSSSENGDSEGSLVLSADNLLLRGTVVKNTV
jgi:magnesium-transporting ATPase (P-type)